MLGFPTRIKILKKSDHIDIVVGKCSGKSLNSKIFSWKEPFEVGKTEISWKDFVVVRKTIVVGKISLWLERSALVKS